MPLVLTNQRMLFQNFKRLATLNRIRNRKGRNQNLRRRLKSKRVCLKTKNITPARLRLVNKGRNGFRLQKLFARLSKSTLLVKIKIRMETTKNKAKVKRSRKSKTEIHKIQSKSKHLLWNRKAKARV